ncbi:TorD/DmsD family molecular chaperone [Avibacterium paragallinarum]|uniref:Molecular chaperone n=1 Tax=Avibacterium paragallinarum TaxID=728 RepID=A0AAE5TFV3_AVIPA|nr:molecular chaperone [Avibacterium paragallinarum]MEE3609745.1 molecular chaperone [Avibacterium paragallinarum]MEE3622242.1 molecular chaperone [Avibacterium paragallinarum]MEE3669535.1 molecular chaperone [Avibacterium paragallinarum]MEE3681851.1 molecular chaperone [Avibacterium paragallinarum]MEE4387067.1 molecular chaperone [Avibacterium paragallinarum]
MSQQSLNHFSLISRLFGNLFYRSPQDPTLQNVFVWLHQQPLNALWALETDKQSEQALAALQMKIDLALLDQEYQRLFGGENPLVKTDLATYGIDPADFLAFRQERGMPEVEQSAVGFPLVFLTASWIEDNLDSTEAQKTLFAEFLLPCASKFLSAVETQANLPFYRSLAILSREILSAMADELEEIADK